MGTTKREYYIGSKAPRRPMVMTIRPKNVVMGRQVRDAYKFLPLHKQFFKLMQWCGDNGMVLTKGDIIAILRPKIDMSPIKKEELDEFNTSVFAFRKWLGALAGMVVYPFKIRVTKNGPLEYVYRPLKNKREYMTVAGRQIEDVDRGLRGRQKENLELLSMTPRQIEKRITEVSNEIDAEVGLPPESRKKRGKRSR